ncbi:RagB/SusD family nutrient uptake outer membrane protein [Arenibacter sp. S6351L]|uniref:RagB/SusD family nutrient uptake outer membrane protein n=1 Tax=Arenibacter sp. S6351L TaxID=2926407 RepID=UPI001FF365FC|nr:RagB/SusD family nutrient uptake outer membrane protein [Arenibacter sp. S6351L]MCK0136066.1 RagB/SusD family nutrient uptake outer membrane protein [Arenibacter sp. S6351L]
MKNIKSIFTLFTLILTLFACEKGEFLDRPPLDQVPEESFFEKSSNLELYVNQFYTPNDMLLDYGGNGGLNYSLLLFSSEAGTDNFITESIDTRMNGQNVVPSTGGRWDFTWIRRANYFLENYDLCTDPFDDYKQYVGEVYFFRALIYFNLVKRFGDVPWYDKVLDVDSEELFNSRTPRNEVIDNIIADLDTAALYLTTEKNDNGLRLNKWTALALQSRVALYEGTWEKYHANDPFKASNPDPDKYFNKVVESCSIIMDSGRFDISSTSNPQTDYHDLFNLPDYSSNKEVLLWKKFDKSLGIKNYRSIVGAFPTGQGVVKSLADAFLSADGNPISISPLFQGHDSYADEAENRDPRYYQTIITPNAPYEIDKLDTISYWKDMIFPNLFSSASYAVPAGYIQRKGYNAQISTHDKAGNNEPIILFRYAEVLLNYIEAKAELGDITQLDIDNSIKLIRDRIGMPNIDLGNIPIDPDWQFPELSPIINEIRRERRVELSLEGFRLDDILRWAVADKLIAGIRPKGIFFGEQFPDNPYPDDSEGFMDPYQSALPNGYNFKIDRDYLLPLPQDQLTLNPQLEQNPGW